MKYFPVRIYFSVCLSILSFIPVIRAGAQQKKDAAYAMKVYNDANPMMQNNITDMAFDRYHYLWIATQFGLLRYDGRSFVPITTYTHSALKYNRIMSLGTDASQNLYTTDEHWNFYKILPSETLELIPDYNKDGFFLHVPHCPVFFFKPKHHFESAKELRDTININTEGIKQVYLLDSAEAYIFFTDTRGKSILLFLQNGNIRGVPLPSTVDPAEGFVLDGQLFLLDGNGGSLVIKDTTVVSDSEKWMPARAKGAFPAKNSSRRSNSRIKFFSTEEEAMFVLDHTLFSVGLTDKNLVAEVVFRDIALENIDQIVYSKQENTYFLGTSTKGMIVLQEKNFQTRRIAENYYTTDNYYYSQVEIPGNRILTNNFTVFSEDGAGKLPHPAADRLAMLKDRYGNIWYARNDSLIKTPDEGKREKFIGPVSEGTLNGFSEQSQGIWFTNPNMLGFIKNDSIRIVKGIRAFDSSAIQCIGNRIDSTVLIGTQLGLYKLQLKDSSIVRLNTDPLYVRTIYTCDLGYTWIGTYGQGMYCLYHNQLTKLPTDKMGYLLNVHCFLEDKEGFFWVSTNNGLFKINKADLIKIVHNGAKNIYYHYFDKSDGFLTNEFNGGCSPCGIKLTNGSFSFPSLDGLVWFAPSRVTIISPKFPLYIDKMTVDSTSFSPDDNTIIKPAFNQLQFEVSTPYYGNSHNLLVEYKLEGLNDEWNVLNPDGKIIYNKLPKGNYTLEVRKLAGFGQQDYETRKIRFTILPRFTETPLFYFLSLLVLLGLIFLAYRLRYQWILSINKKLEKEVRIRIEEKEKLINDLKQNIIDLNLSRENENRVNDEKQKLISILVHDLSSPLRFLSKMANRLSLNLQLYNNAEQKRVIRELSASSGEIYSFTDNFLNWLTPSRSKVKAETETFDMGEILQELKVFHTDTILSKNNRVDIIVDKPSIVKSRKSQIRTIIRNLIYYINSNIRDSVILITFKKDAHHAVLRFSYQGGVIPDELIHRINIRELYPTDLEINEFPTYINFAVNQALADQLSGSVHITSSPAEGTLIAIEFPDLTA